MKQIERPLIYTHIFFLIPIVVSYLYSNHAITLILVLATLLSAAHHTFKKPGSEWWWHTKGRKPFQTLLLLSEMSLAITLAAWSLILLPQKHYLVSAIASIIFIPSFIMFLNSDYKKYVFYHSIWHIGCAIVISLVLI